MKKLLLALLAVALGVVLAIVIVRQRSNTIVVERTVDGVPIIEVGGVLDAAGARKIVRALRAAEHAKPRMLVVSMDSPGGELAATMAVADVLSGLVIPTTGFVQDGLGGTVLLIAAADRIYFAPDGVCGSAFFPAPGGDSEASTVMQKVQSHIASRLRSYAETNGHDADVFLAFIDPDIELIRAGKTWKKKGQLMSLTASEAWLWDIQGHGGIGR